MLKKRAFKKLLKSFFVIFLVISWILTSFPRVHFINFPPRVKETQAAFGTGTATCTAQSKTAGTTLSCTVATANFAAGDIAMLWFAGDNVATVDGNDGLLSSVTDSKSNTWTVQRCFTNGNGTAATGATTCIAWSKLATALVSATDTITANFSSITAKAIVTKDFTVTAGNTIQVAGTPQDLANDVVDPGSMVISGLTSGQYLFVRSSALERATASTWTVTTNYTSSGCNGTTGGGAATNMDDCGEFRIFTGTGDTSNPTATAVDNANIFIAFQEVAQQPAFTQNNYRFYVTANSVTLTDPWPSGTLDLGEKAALTQLPVQNLALVSGDKIRIKINFGVTVVNLAATTQAFQLEYSAAEDCTTASSWTAVGAKASASIWRLFDEVSIGDSTVEVNNLSDSTGTAQGYYSEINPSATNPNAVNTGQFSEWDWPVENNGAAENTTYCFRMAKSGGTAFNSYGATSYPKITTAPGVSVLMRHGNFFQNQAEKGFFWAN